jgi:3-methylcrotonyl-CoA carboxylase alpha subunit
MFLPSPGRLERFILPETRDGIRIDSGVRQGDQVTIHYDPMIAKVVCHAGDRSLAIEKMLATLESVAIEGLHTNVSFLRQCITHPAFRAGDTHTGFVEAYKAELTRN